MSGFISNGALLGSTWHNFAKYPGQIYSLSFGTAGDRYASATSVLSATPGTVRVRFRVAAVPSGGFTWLAGFSAVGTGWLFATQDVIGGATPQLVLYAGLDGVLTRVGGKFLLAEQIGHIATLHIVFDGSKVRWYFDGQELAKGAVSAGFGTAYTTYNQPSVALGIGSEAGTGSYTSPQSIVEVATSSAIFSTTQILTDVSNAVGTSMINETHRWTADATTAAIWAANTGTDTLTRTGSPTISSVPALMLKTKLIANCFGDSITAGTRSGFGSGNGWRKKVQQICALAGKGVSFTGSSVATETYDYDYWNNGTPGEALITRLSTFATDLTNVGGIKTGVVLAYGINDMVALNRTSAQLVTDITSACSLIQAARPNVPICIVNILPRATGITTAPQLAQIAIYQAQFATMITSLKSSGYNVVGADVSVCITNANDTTQLFDGTHPTPSYYDAMGTVIANALMTLL